MTNVITLDWIKKSAEKDFAPTKIDLGEGDPITLRNIVRLNKRDRGVILAGIEELGTKDENDEAKITIDQMIEIVEKILRLVANDPKRLLRALDGDLGMLMTVLNTWMEESEVGEAQDSPN